jgi:DNA primase
MPSFDIPAIRSALPIEQILEPRGVTLRRGRGACLICGTSDQSQAFSVRGDRWRCFACQAHGDVIDLVQALDSVPVGEAIRRCAALGGVDSHGKARTPGPRPISPRQVLAAKRTRAWWEYLKSLRASRQLAANYHDATVRLGIDHELVVYYGQLLGAALNRELVAAERYDAYAGEEGVQ